MGVNGCGSKLYSEEKILKELQSKYNISFVVSETTPLRYGDYFKEAIAEERRTYGQEYSYLENAKFIKYDISTSEFPDLSFEAYAYISHAIMAGSLNEPYCTDNVKEVYFVSKFEQWAKENGISYSITNPGNVLGQSRDIGPGYRIFIDYTADEIDWLSQELVAFLYMMKEEPLIAVPDDYLSVQIFPGFTWKDGITSAVYVSYLTLNSFWIGVSEPDYFKDIFRRNNEINEDSVKKFFEYFANK